MMGYVINNGMFSTFVPLLHGRANNAVIQLNTHVVALCDRTK